MTFQEEFNNPSVKYRIKPFWFWNGELTEREIEIQIKEMAEKGLGGFFICARQGMSVPYLSQKWFDLVKFAAKKARDFGLEAWLYDEYPYPSGMSGGEVLLEHPEAEHMILKHISKDIEGLQDIEINLGWSGILYAKAFPVEKNKIKWDFPLDLKSRIGSLQTTQLYQTTGLTKYNNKRFFSYGPQKILSVKLPKGKWHIEVYTQTAMGDFKYYGGFFDPCNENAVKTFLNTTHERYRKAFGDGFGTFIQGMFSDEVGLLSPIPWSKLIPEYFERLKGYQIQEVLPALHNNTYQNAIKIRYDLYDALHKLFVESYHKQVAHWCKNNNLYYATEVPSMRMSTQRYSTIVGGDTAHEKLGKPLEWIYDEYIRNYRSNAKSVSSLSRQLGNEFAMIESFHSVGWTMNMQDAKWMIDRLGASGINLYNFHAFYYTIDAITKHDAPPSQFIQNPYWKHYKVLSDYVGRMGAFVTNTEAVIHVAVLDPVASLWSYLANPFHGFIYEGEDEHEKFCCDKLRDDWVSICKTLLFQQIDYDHLDAEILADAKIENGEIRLGRACYQVLIIPPSVCIEDNAFKKVKEFVQQGGKAAALGMLPTKPLGEENSQLLWQKLFGMNQSFQEEYFGGKSNNIIENNNICFYGDVHSKNWIDWCRGEINSLFEIRPDQQNQKNIVSTIRKDKEENIYIFVANQGARKTDVTIKYKNKMNFKTTEYCLENGTTKNIYLEDNILRLLPYESRCIQFSKVKRNHQDVQDKTANVIVIDTKNKMKVTIQGKNIFRLEEFEVSKDKLQWHKSTVKTFVEQCSETPILSGENYSFHGDFGTPKEITIQYPLNVYYRTTFEVKKPIEAISLLMDRGTIKDSFEIRLNNHILKIDDFISTFIIDFNNLLCDISGYLVQGLNELEIRVQVTKDEDGIRDPLYLYGEFGVQMERENLKYLTKISNETKLDLNYVKGFPYYSGTFDFETHVFCEDAKKDYLLKFDFEQACHECIEVFVNDKSIGVKAFSPYIWQTEKTIWKKGKNKINIKLTNTLGNMLDGMYFDYEKHLLVKI
ncbi:alpha-L-rhamnosidase-like protein [Lachnotalea glycerini]|uniref:Alpha-L-rhamnosidase-like protein n=1 Tax=Lachnotalea glycerini TaxID=1763509 RepID=A0A255IPB3_9FIRM|nr:glycosyl hydrolase [Lachnotalea glycerini]PXV85586.1 alpha-L-rhamnosidase-like protein [Lachnotalea glycerini]RDY31123.1 hypothetical protein CG710_011070 [Lachnotalea glycerini]